MAASYSWIAKSYLPTRKCLLPSFLWCSASARPVNGFVSLTSAERERSSPSSEMVLSLMSASFFFVSLSPPWSADLRQYRYVRPMATGAPMSNASCHLGNVDPVLPVVILALELIFYRLLIHFSAGMTA
uniref:Putative secreted protein n=1 Tax=Anopheles darlingi TaxID=43151 RepID=A0A2M4D5A3_ANODA